MTEPTKILVIDDNEGDWLLYERCLQRSAGATYAVSEAVSGEDGLVCIDKETFDCVLLDYSLPGRNGVEILKRIRVKHPFLPVVMLTGSDYEKAAIAAMREGAQNYLTKENIDSETLTHAIQDAIRHCMPQNRGVEQ
jgi:DNA-binding NtrC family response regulator